MWDETLTHNSTDDLRSHNFEKSKISSELIFRHAWQRKDMWWSHRGKKEQLRDVKKGANRLPAWQHLGIKKDQKSQNKVLQTVVTLIIMG